MFFTSTPLHCRVGMIMPTREDFKPAWTQTACATLHLASCQVMLMIMAIPSKLVKNRLAIFIDFAN